MLATGRWASWYLTARWPVLEGEIMRYKNHWHASAWYLVAIVLLFPSRDGHGLIYFKRRFHPVVFWRDGSAPV